MYLQDNLIPHVGQFDKNINKLQNSPLHPLPRENIPPIPQINALKYTHIR